jgi:hypothetical protein
LDKTVEDYINEFYEECKKDEKRKLAKLNRKRRKNINTK